MNKNKKYTQTDISKNENCDIKVVYGNVDELSHNEIYNNRKNIKQIEEDFTERIKYSSNVISSANLPKELQNYFDIKSKIVNDELEYYTEPKTDDAYLKFPYRINFKMQFDTIEQKNKFIENGGIYSLVERANKTRKPVEIPNISEMKDFLGAYENPISKMNNQNVGRIQLYVFPEELPKAEEYSIEIFDNDICFKIESTSLRIVEKDDDYFIINNSESVDEPFNVSLKFTKNEDVNEGGMIFVTTNITISIRENYKKSILYNLEFQKYFFTMNSSNSTMIIKNLTKNIELIRIDNIGNENYIQNQYDFFERFQTLLLNVLFIAKKYGLNIEYDVDFFQKNEDLINIIASDIKNKKYKLHEAVIIGVPINEEYNEEIHSNIITAFPNIYLFDKEFELKHNRAILRNCEYIKEEVLDGQNILHLKSKDIEYNINNENEQ